MDPYTLAYLAGHSDFSTTRRYVHPQVHTINAAMERARTGRGGHKSGHNPGHVGVEGNTATGANSLKEEEKNGRGERIRTSDLSVPNRAHYQAVLRPESSLDNRERGSAMSNMIVTESLTKLN